MLWQLHSIWHLSEVLFFADDSVPFVLQYMKWFQKSQSGMLNDRMVLKNCVDIDLGSVKDINIMIQEVASAIEPMLHPSFWTLIEKYVLRDARTLY